MKCNDPYKHINAKYNLLIDDMGNAPDKNKTIAMRLKKEGFTNLDICKVMCLSFEQLDKLTKTKEVRKSYYAW